MTDHAVRDADVGAGGAELLCPAVELEKGPSEGSLSRRRSLLGPSPGRKRPSRGLLRDCEIFANLRITLVSSSPAGHVVVHDDGVDAVLLPPHLPHRDRLRPVAAALGVVEVQHRQAAARLLAEISPEAEGC